MIFSWSKKTAFRLLFWGSKTHYFSSNHNQTFQICLYTTLEEFHKKNLYIYIYVRKGGEITDFHTAWDPVPNFWTSSKMYIPKFS